MPLLLATALGTLAQQTNAVSFIEDSVVCQQTSMVGYGGLRFDGVCLIPARA